MARPANEGHTNRARFERLVALMAQLAEGDLSALLPMQEEFGGSIEAALRRHFAHFNVTPTADDLDELLRSVLVMLADTAKAWRPDGGALPWNWAGRRVQALVSAHIGHHTDVLDDGLVVAEEPAPPAPDDGRDELAVLADLADHHPGARLLRQAMAECLNEEQQAVLLLFEARKADGDPSPANTLAQLFGRRPATVRQTAKRSRDRLGQLVRSDDRFRSLRELPWLR